ncbi:MAG: ribosome recycling factor [Flavobacteriaceae bacterium]|nr:ribosome recycling factor [Flavobacteriaceae bacterium]
MKEELDLIFDLAKESMSNAITHLEKKLMNIRAGKANPNMLSNVTVEYYGTNTPLSQVANINTPDGRTIIIQPWEKSILPEVEKGIEIANLGFNPMNNGENIIINVPALTEERRTELAKQAKTETEETKIAIRNARKEANNEIKKYSNFSEDLKKNSELDIQEITDNYIEKVDKIFKLKQKEIMTL